MSAHLGLNFDIVLQSVWNIVVQATGLGQGFTDNSNVRLPQHNAFFQRRKRL